MRPDFMRPAFERSAFQRLSFQRLTSALLAAPLACAALAGCSSVDTASLATGPAPATASLGVAVPPERALAMLPAEAGAVVSVVERRSADGDVTQTVTLAGDPGARDVDRIEVTAHPKAFRGSLSRRVDAETIEAEMDEAFPGVAMTVSPRVVTGPSGPVGLATGSAGGVSCLYAWSNGEARSRSTTGGTLFGAEASDLQVRVRLCRKGVSEERLAAFAEGLRIASDLGGPTTGTPVAAAGTDALASAGYGGPVAATGTTAPAKPAATAARQPHRPAPRAVEAATPRTVVAKSVPKAEPPATVAAPIPLPSGG